MHIDIWSDIVCPWCYLGKRRFERALAAFPHRDEVDVLHRSFQLDPTRPRGEIISRRGMLMEKYRLSEDQVRANDDRLERLAAAEGLDYDLGDDGMIGNTFDAHRLVHFARTKGLDDDMLERLFSAYFSERRSIFDTPSLVALAGEVGLDIDETRVVLDEHRFADAVETDIDEAQFFGATGVPFFVVGGRYGVSGAQDVELFGQVLERAWSESAAEQRP